MKKKNYNKIILLNHLICICFFGFFFHNCKKASNEYILLKKIDSLNEIVANEKKSIKIKKDSISSLNIKISHLEKLNTKLTKEKNTCLDVIENIKKINRKNKY